MNNQGEHFVKDIFGLLKNFKVIFVFLLALREILTLFK
jgi:hypothetical protein